MRRRWAGPTGARLPRRALTVIRFKLLAPLVILASLALSAGPAAAAAPEQFGPFTESGSFTVDCGTFEATVTGTVTTHFKVFFDADGNVTRFQQFVLAPHDVWQNTQTGKSIVVRGQFEQTGTRIAGTDEFRLTVVGHRYLVNEPGAGVIVQEVGRIVYADLTEQAIISMAGMHDLASEALIGPTICGAIS